jgi:prefoldin subunit 5
MTGFVDIDDEKNTLEEIDRDKQIILEQLDILKNKAEIIEEMMEEVTATANRLKWKMDRLEENAKKIRREKK